MASQGGAWMMKSNSSSVASSASSSAELEGRRRAKPKPIDPFAERDRVRNQVKQALTSAKKEASAKKVKEEVLRRSMLLIEYHFQVLSVPLLRPDVSQDVTVSVALEMFDKLMSTSVQDKRDEQLLQKLWTQEKTSSGVAALRVSYIRLQESMK